MNRSGKTALTIPFLIFSFLINLACVGSVKGVDAWQCTGHMVVAEVAKQILDQKSPSTKSAVEAIVEKFSEDGPWPMNPDMTQLACWSDDIKANIGAMNLWHYINQPYNPDGITPLPFNPAGKSNIVIQIKNFYKSLNLSSSNPPNDWEKGFAVAWLTHLIGDIHQPLHTTTLYDNYFKNGDAGGNLFYFQLPGSQLGMRTPLHRYWDSGCGSLSFNFPRPLGTVEKKNISAVAADLLQRIVPSVDEQEVSDPQIMAEESYKVAIANVYLNHTLQPNQLLPSGYEEQCQKAVDHQITLAGYRLANQFIRLLEQN